MEKITAAFSNDQLGNTCTHCNATEPNLFGGFLSLYIYISHSLSLFLPFFMSFSFSLIFFLRDTDQINNEYTHTHAIDRCIHNLLDENIIRTARDEKRLTCVENVSI